MSTAHPRKVGKYDVVSVLGHGAMGVVYRAVDSALGRQVAIKSMSADLAPNSDFRLRFLREARAVAQLQHPNIITIHELVEEGETAYIVMELLEG
ncbi:MAG: protein kinase domain-containing protein, partial [Vicinamibacteria bacterium]